MLHYVDGFSCSLKQTSGSLVIHFTQKEPIVKEEGGVDVIINPVTSIIMENDSAKALLALLNDIYGKELSEADDNLSE